MKKSSCDEACEEVVVPCKPIIAELSQLALRFLELGERYDPRGVAAQLRGMAVANIHTRIKVSDLWVVRGYVGDQQCPTRPTHL